MLARLHWLLLQLLSIVKSHPISIFEFRISNNEWKAKISVKWWRKKKKWKKFGGSQIPNMWNNLNRMLIFVCVLDNNSISFQRMKYRDINQPFAIRLINSFNWKSFKSIEVFFCRSDFFLHWFPFGLGEISHHCYNKRVSIKKSLSPFFN